MKASRGWCAAAALAGSQQQTTAWAQTVPRSVDAPAERASARAMADQGFDAFDAGQWQLALDRFERAQALVQSPVHRLFIARCLANLGRLLESRETYVAITRERLAADAPPAVSEALQAASSELVALDARIPFVVVALEGELAGGEPEVSMDGRPLPPALLGVYYPIDPGSHTWQARVGQRQSTLESRVLREGTRETITLVLAPPRHEGARSPLAPLSPAPVPDASVAARSDAMSWGIIAGLGVGAVGAGVGAVFALRKGSLDDRIERTCRADGCPGTRENLEREDDANRAGLFATIAFIGAGAGVATAVTLLVLDAGETSPEQAPVAALTPWLGLGGAGVSGRF
ncbi:MAG: hypothetical protein ABW217_05970 [Polyangiaceae bacterium]